MRSLRSGCLALVLTAIAPAASAEPTPKSTATQADAPASAESPRAAPPQTPPPAPYPYPYPPAYPPAPYGQPAYPQYCPACPPGTACMNGGCIPVYPVPCPPDMLPDGAGNCVPAAGTRETPAEVEARAARLERRLHGKLTIDLDLSVCLMGDAPDPVIAPAFSVMAGYRRNFAPWFGLILRGGPLMGVATFEDSGYSSSYSSNGSTSNRTDTTTMAGAIAEVLPYFGPFGRIYLAPSFSVLYLWFDSPGLSSGNDHVGLDSGARMAMGFHMGWVLGDRERTVVSVGGRFTTLNTVTVFFTAGVGFQIF